jgi:hypothetical protein
MRSSRRTTPQVAENSVVDDATDACSLRRIFATFLAVSSASLGRPYFYLVLIQSNGWKSLCLLTELSVQDYSNVLFQSKLVRVRNNKDDSRSITVDRDKWNLFFGLVSITRGHLRKGGRVELMDGYIKHAAIKRTMGGGLIIPQQSDGGCGNGISGSGDGSDNDGNNSNNCSGDHARGRGDGISVDVGSGINNGSKNGDSECDCNGYGDIGGDSNSYGGGHRQQSTKSGSERNDGLG